MNKDLSAVWQAIIAKSPAIISTIRLYTHKAHIVDFLAPLFLRLYLAPIFWMAGTQKFTNFTATAEWFGNTESGLGLPMPYLLVFLVGLFEILGAILLLFGAATRLITLPLMIIMLIAGYTAHWQNGWLAIATGDGIFASDRTRAAVERLQSALEILQSQGDYAWLTENGSFVVLNNGIEFAATYFIMLLVLFFTGGGRFVSADYWLSQVYFREKQ